MKTHYSPIRNKRLALKVWKSAIIISLLLIPYSNFAQEKLLPILDNQITIVDAKLAKEAQLFAEYDKFIEAKLFRLSDTLFVIEVFYYKNDSIYKDRKLMNEAEKLEFQNNLYQAITIQSPEKMLDQSGRTALIAGSLLTSLAYYGYAIPMSLDVESSKSFIAMYMLSGAAGFFIPYTTTKNKTVSVAQASLSFYGQSRGIYHGMSVPMLFDENPDFKTVLGAGVVVSLFEGFMGNHLARSWNYTAGAASMMQMGGDMGTAFGFLFSDVLNFYNDGKTKAIFGTALASSYLGLWAGKRMGDTRQYTTGDAIVFRSTVILSSYIPLIFVNYTEPDKSKPFTIAALSGGAIGCFFAQRLVKNKEFSTGQGVLISLGELAGGLLGLGAAYLIAPDDDSDKLFMTGIGIGGIAGLAIMYRQFSGRASINNDSDLSFNFSINPFGIGQLINKKSFGNQYSELFILNCRF